MRYALVILSQLVLYSALWGQSYWPQWRGPAQNGVSTADDLPTTWNAEKNILWKTPLPSWGGSTPIAWEQRIFLISPSKAEAGENLAPTAVKRSKWGGLPGAHPGGDQLLLLCIDRSSGAILWQRQLDQGNSLRMKHNAASPSPMTDGRRVWAATGNGVINAFDMEGQLLWRMDLQQEYGKFGLVFGYASSPLYYDGKLFLQVLHGQKTDDPSYIVALDAHSGESIWRVERPTDAVNESPDAYTTPALLDYDGRHQVIISGGDYVTGHDPQTGKELWRAGGLNPNKEGNYRIVGSPIAIDGMIYAPTRKKPLLALHAGGQGDITESHLAWKFTGPGAPDVPTPATDGRYFYMVDDKGRATCLDAKTGALIWGPERTQQGIVSSSPVVADGKLYVLNERGITTVLTAGPQYKVLATNELDGSYTLSSIAVADQALLVRHSRISLLHW
jgi:outer membrane protein assembly factor BamB